MMRGIRNPPKEFMFFRNQIERAAAPGGRIRFICFSTVVMARRRRGCHGLARLAPCPGRARAVAVAADCWAPAPPWTNDATSGNWHGVLKNLGPMTWTLIAAGLQGLLADRLALLATFQF